MCPSEKPRIRAGQHVSLRHATDPCRTTSVPQTCHGSMSDNKCPSDMPRIRVGQQVPQTCHGSVSDNKCLSDMPRIRVGQQVSLRHATDPCRTTSVPQTCHGSVSDNRCPSEMPRIRSSGSIRRNGHPSQPNPPFNCNTHTDATAPIKRHYKTEWTSQPVQSSI